MKVKASTLRVGDVVHDLGDNLTVYYVHLHTGTRHGYPVDTTTQFVTFHMRGTRTYGGSHGMPVNVESEVPADSEVEVVCSHPDDALLYVTWDGPLGHGWECGNCGELVQVG
jgi:hypothetical protein